jgi:hypothetical protein
MWLTGDLDLIVLGLFAKWAQGKEFVTARDAAKGGNT